MGQRSKRTIWPLTPDRRPLSWLWWWWWWCWRLWWGKGNMTASAALTPTSSSLARLLLLAAGFRSVSVAAASPPPSGLNCICVSWSARSWGKKKKICHWAKLSFYGSILFDWNSWWSLYSPSGTIGVTFWVLTSCNKFALQAKINIA